MKKYSFAALIAMFCLSCHAAPKEFCSHFDKNTLSYTVTDATGTLSVSHENHIICATYTAPNGSDKVKFHVRWNRQKKEHIIVIPSHQSLLFKTAIENCPALRDLICKIDNAFIEIIETPSEDFYFPGKWLREHMKNFVGSKIFPGHLLLQQVNETHKNFSLRETEKDGTVTITFPEGPYSFYIRTYQSEEPSPYQIDIDAKNISDLLFFLEKHVEFEEYLHHAFYDASVFLLVPQGKTDEELESYEKQLRAVMRKLPGIRSFKVMEQKSEYKCMMAPE
ncbi:hypothetical protein HOD08_02930 [bacterium]|nr:hypothetical protein [bacterium]